MRRALLATVALSVCCTASLCNTVTGTAAEGDSGKKRIYPVWWTVASVEGKYTFKAHVKAYYRCGRQKQPFVEVRVREQTNRAIIRMIRHWPPDLAQNCMNLNPLGTEKTVKLHRPLRELKLYDVSKSPPQHRALPWEWHR